MTIVAFTEKTVLEAALAYHDMGFSLIPCLGKRPAIASWSQYQERRAERTTVAEWFTPKGQSVRLNPTFYGNQGQGHQSIGVVLGKVSQNLVVIDLDGEDAIKLFYATFPKMVGLTLTIATGSGVGRHLYFYLHDMPKNQNIRLATGGGIEIRGNGQYVIAPPSLHEKTGLPYEAKGLRPIHRAVIFTSIIEQLEALRGTNQHGELERVNAAAAAKPVPLNQAVQAKKRAYLETVVSQELARVRTSSAGNRNKSLWYAALRLANFVAGGELSEHEMKNRLANEAANVNLPALEAHKTIESAFNIGKKQPKTVS